MLSTVSCPVFGGLPALMGAGTALVYPTFLASVAEYSPLAQRAHSVGIFRFWRDAGYAIGALLTGIPADAFGLGAALAAIVGLTVLSALTVRWRMYCLPMVAPVVGSRSKAYFQSKWAFYAAMKMKVGFA